jgi:hypothetical protein
MTRVFFLFCLCLAFFQALPLMADEASDPVIIRVVPNKFAGIVDFYAVNHDREKHYRVSLDFSELKNMTAQEPLPVLKAVPPYSSVLLERLTYPKAEYSHYNYRYRYFPMDPREAFPYQLPIQRWLKEGKLQSAPSLSSAQLTMDLPAGTDISAARGGKVTRVDVEDRWATVTVAHEDGTWADYGCLDAKKVKVSVGTTLNVGDLVGMTTTDCTFLFDCWGVFGKQTHTFRPNLVEPSAAAIPPVSTKSGTGCFPIKGLAAPMGSTKGYLIYYTRTAGQGYVRFNGPDKPFTDVSNILITGVDPDTDYYFKVSAISDTGAESSSADYLIHSTSCGQATRAVPQGCFAVRPLPVLTGSARGYLVAYSTAPNRGFVSANAKSHPFTDPAHIVITGVEPNRIYYYSVSTVDDKGEVTMGPVYSVYSTGKCR